MTDQYQPTAAETATDARRKRGAIGGALAGVAVIALLVAVFVAVKVAGDDKSGEAAPAAAPPAAAAPVQQLDPALQTEPVVKAGQGKLAKLVVTPLVKGAGAAVAAGQTITANYVGVTYKDGKIFDSSWKSGQKLESQIGAGRLIPGFDKGLVGVPVGSRVQIDIPAAMAYGEKASGGAPSGDLRFVVDILQAS